jgi:hypothetical protein
MLKDNYGGDDMINWNEAPAWSNCALTTSVDWVGAKRDVGNIEFTIFDGKEYWAEEAKEVCFTISDEYWRVAEYRPSEHKTITNEKFADGDDMSIDKVLAERGNRYGAFKDGANIMQQLKSVMRSTDGWERLTYSQKEALEMIQHKIGRVLNGDPTYVDSWTDISGYSQLIVSELEGDIR